MVGDDVSMVQMLYIREVSLQEEDVLPVQTDRFYRQDLTSIYMRAFLDDSVSTLSDLLPYHVFLQ